MDQTPAPEDHYWVRLVLTLVALAGISFGIFTFVTAPSGPDDWFGFGAVFRIFGVIIGVVGVGAAILLIRPTGNRDG